MSERKRCVRCDRTIDQWSKICPYCNWDQAEAPPPPKKFETAAPPPDPRLLEMDALRKKGLLAAGGVLVFILAFLVGMVINREDAPESAPEPLAEQAAKENVPPAVRADTPLVPVGASEVERPITSAPAPVPDASLPSEYARTDATAVSALEYARLAQRARAEPKRAPSFVDPRSLTGPAYAQAPRRPSAPAAPSGIRAAAGAVPAASRTRPVPEYQPIPPLRGSGTARLTLLVGPDGRVRHINIERALRGGNTAALVAAVQRWRFKPATDDGQPVQAPYSVDISFER